MKLTTAARAAILAAVLPAVGLLGCDSGPLSSAGGADSLRVTVTFPDSEDHTSLVSYVLDHVHGDDVLSERYIARPLLIGNIEFTIPAPPPGSEGKLIIRADETASVTARLIGHDGSSTEIPREEYPSSDTYWYLVESSSQDQRIPSPQKGNLVAARLKMGKEVPEPGCVNDWTVQIVGGYTRVRYGDLVMDRSSQATLSAPLGVHFIALRMADVVSVDVILPVGASVDVSVDDRAADFFGCSDYGCGSTCFYYFRRGDVERIAEGRRP